MSTLEERALADSDDSDRFVTSGYGDAITSFVAQTRALVAVTAERDEALARNERQRATLAKIRTIVTGHEAALVVTRVLAALDEGSTQPKGSA